ncbi:FeoB-associated Cys-rich membrane protein [Flintibacter muris]|nr:FeoB-associated Cys-rich membrane protein [Flintibacter muris]
MTPGEIVVLLALAGVVGLAVRSLWKSHKAGGHCNGDCSQCSGCHHK